MLFKRRYRVALLAAAVFCMGLVSGALPAAAADLRLIMFEQDGCPWCAHWNAEVGPAYPKTEEGKLAPLTRLDIHAAVPEGMQLKRAPTFTPTFVLLKDGQEVGRIQGYPGEDFFWGMLDELLKKAGQDPSQNKS